ncbi:MAG TPA: FtsX-like permease family protein [Conexibacter sp.]|nr:FtsX-like permease family protein [Conexibacter sp.]
MPLTSLVHLYRVRLRSRLVQELLALAGIAVGVALVFAALVANTSLTGSVRQLTSGIVGQTRYQLAARGPRGFEQSLLAEVERLSGVQAAAPVLEVQANVIGPRGSRSVEFVGGDPRFARLGGVLLRHFTAAQLSQQQALALPAPMADALDLSLGDSVRLQVGTRTVAVPLGAELQQHDIGALVHSPVAIAPLPFAQRVSGMAGRVTRIFVEPQRGRDREVEDGLRRIAAGRLNVRAADDDVAVFEQAAYPTNQSTAMFSVFSALVGFLFAFSAVLLTVPQRRRFVADLRMAGNEPWVLVQVLLFDALVLGVAGAAIGLALGDVISAHLFGGVPGYLAYAFAIGSQRIVTWQSVAIAGGAGVVAACVAVLAPLRDILAGPAGDEPVSASEHRSHRLVAAGVACFAVTTLIVVVAPRAALAGLVALTLALLLLLPSLLRLLTRGFELATRAVRSPVPTLAVLELRSGRARLRTIALASTGAIAVFATVAIGGAHSDLQRGLDASAREIDGNGDVWASFPGTSNAFAVTPFPVPPRTFPALRGIPGVSAVRIYRGSFLNVGDHRAWVQAPPRSAQWPIPPTQLRHGDLARATARLRAGGWAVLSESVAAVEHVGIGDRVILPTPVPTPLRVAAISTNLGWPPGAIVLNADDYARAWGSEAPSALQIGLAHGASPTRVAAAVRRTLGPALPANVETRAQRMAMHYAASRQGLERLTQISILVLVAAMLAMAAAMGGMIWQRRPSLAALKVHGYPEAELWRALLLESGLLLGAGCLVGAAFGLYGQVLLSRALETITGFPVFYSTAGLGALAILALVTLVAVAMLAVPGWLAVRVPPSPGGATN